MRADGRANDALRPVTIDRHYTKHAEGAVMVSFGDTRVLCTATVEPRVPSFLQGGGTGWITAEYAMLPRSSDTRISRDAVKKGRALEISRLIGRSLRAAVDLSALGERQIILDCDVLQADGGTRTAAITGAYVALHDALTGLAASEVVDRAPVLGQCAAVSLGLVGGDILLDLCYSEDSMADIDLNLVMRSDDTIIEVQASAERRTLSRSTLDAMLDLGRKGIAELFAIQQASLSNGT